MTKRPTRHEGSRDQLAVLRAVLALAGEHAELLVHSERVWQSATFSGFRHGSTLLFEGAEAVAAGDAFIEALADHDWRVPHMLVVDAGVVEATHVVMPVQRLTVTVELLLVADEMVP